MNCDLVFDVLTRGPFPTGESSDCAVERHLTCCHECRSLAEALRPAVELFHEAIEPEDGRDLPGYHGALAPLGSNSLVQTVAAAIDAENVCTARVRPVSVAKLAWWEVLAQGPYRFVAAIACGALLALGMWSVSSSDGAGLGGRNITTARFQPSPEGLIHLASLKLPAACSPPGEQTSSAQHCCNECHRPQSGSVRSDSRMILVAMSSCHACHAPQ